MRSRRAGQRRIRRYPRRRGSRKLKTTVLIVGEGEKTEPNYFRGLRREPAVSARFSVTVKKGPGFNPEQVLDKAINLKRRGSEFDEVWCVIDVEGPENRPSLERAIRRAEEHGIALCLSNPAFEIWFLAHYVRKARAFNSCEALISELNKFWARDFNQDYTKGDGSTFRKLRARTVTAIENARWVRESHHGSVASTADANSSTDLYTLVAKLLGREK